MTTPSRYVIGLDLGTTNSTVAYVDSADVVDEKFAIQQFAIPQLVKLGELGEEPMLPSFVYLPGPSEVSTEDLALPWSKQQSWAVGKLAREHGAQTPTRLVSSAKSWLCHGGVDRLSPVLPWAAEEGFARISPVEASARILSHLRDAWNHRIAGKDKSSRFEHQEIILTVPASFDAVARELTIEAARQAGLGQVTLFEEPQAAFYSWIDATGDEWRRLVRAGDVALVIDVGGGTTDLTLIAVKEQDGNLVLDRIAVGDHLLLGGDNMDLALAHRLAAELKQQGTKLDAAQMLQLWHACRSAKEKSFADTKGKPQPVVVLGRGRKVVGGTIRTELARAAVEETLIDGFFPKVALGDMPRQQRGAGLQELGLSYAADPAVTRHLSEFLVRHAEQITQCRGGDKGAAAMPTAILFNGGVFRGEPLRKRVFDVLSGWAAKGSGDVRELSTVDLDLAVSRGAAYYGMVRRGRGVRIRGGVPRSYYIGVEAAMPAVPGMSPPIRAVCVVPQGMEEGTDAKLEGREFGLVVGEPAVFRFLASTQRRGDRMGTVVDDWEDSIEELAPMEITLDSTGEEGRMIPVRLFTKITEVGTLELWCESREAKRRWKLEFNVRESR